MPTYRISQVPARGAILDTHKTYNVFLRHGRLLAFWEKGAPQPTLPDVEGEIVSMNVWQLLVAFRR